MRKKKNRGLRLFLDRSLAHDLFRQAVILLIVLLVALLLSFVLLHISGCNWQDFAENSKVPEWVLPLYLLIDANALNNLYINGVHGWALVASSVVYILGIIIFNGMIISVMTTALSRHVEEHNEGHLHYLKSGHYIIMGYDDMVPSFITHIFEKDKDAYVLILSAANAKYIRERLKKVFTEKEQEHIIINYGHRMSKEYFKDIHLESAEQLYIVGWRTISAHDAINVECVDSICRYLNQPEVTQRPNRITCVFEDLDTYAAFKTSEIFGDVKILNIEFVPYNFYSGWAKQVFVKRFHKDMDKPKECIRYPAVFGNGITPDDPKFVHLVFVGTTNFAVAFAMEAAHVLHFPNFHKKGVKTLITFIDINADKEKDEFVTRNRHFFEVQSHYYQDLSDKSKDETRKKLSPSYFNEENGYKEGIDYDFLDVEFEFIKGDIFSRRVQEVISGWAKETDQQYLSIFLALADQRSNFAFGMNMPDEVYDNEIPVFIRQDRSDNFVSNLRAADEAIKNDKKKNTYVKVEDGEVKTKTLGGRYAHIFPFGMNETAYSADEKSLERAKLINYLYETANYDENKFRGTMRLGAISKERIWADADTYWRELSVALKWSNLYNAYTIRTKIATLRAMRGLTSESTTHDIRALSDTEVEAMAWVEHNRWNVEKLLMGYRKPHKDEDKYAHPGYAGELKKNKNRFIHHDIRPFNELGSIRELDYEFSRYIPWIMKMTEES